MRARGRSLKWKAEQIERLVLKVDLKKVSKLADQHTLARAMYRAKLQGVPES